MVVLFKSVATLNRSFALHQILVVGKFLSSIESIIFLISAQNLGAIFKSLDYFRYGWIPQEQMSSNALSAYDWVYPTSITHMELMHAALRTASPNSLFLLRDPLSLENLPEEFNSSFRDNTSLAQKSLDVRVNSLKNYSWPKLSL